MGKQFLEVVSHPLAGLFGGTVGMAAVFTQKGFGSGEQRPSPAILLSVFVLGVDEIFRNDISAHFEPGNVRVKLAAHFCARKAACFAQVAGDHAAVFFQSLEYHILDASFLRVWKYASAVVAEIRPPLTADEGGFPVEELAIRTPAFLYDFAFPFP